MRPEMAEEPQPANSGVEREIAALRRVVDDLRTKLGSGARAPEASKLPPPPVIPGEAVWICRQLVRRGVESRLAEELVRESLRDTPLDPPGVLFEAVRSLVAERLRPSGIPWVGRERRTIALVGPTGVGKTTTIAKIAARALLDSKLRVELITVDTYGIGASERLCQYGEIMGLSTRVARDPAQLVAAAERVPEADLVLIDSAGRSDPDTIAHQMAMLRAVPGLEMHLVLSAATGAREIGAAGRRYREHGIDRLIFSKLDEADGPGSVLSALAAVPRPISCVTNGQRVPDDLHVVDKSGLLDLVTGPPRNKESAAWTKQTA